MLAFRPIRRACASWRVHSSTSSLRWGTATATRLQLVGAVMVVGATAVTTTVQCEAGGYGLRKDGTFGVIDDQQHPKMKPRVVNDDQLPLMALDQVRKMAKDRVVVTYDGYVYEIPPEFLLEHPGGTEVLVNARGRDLEEIWASYAVHFKKADTLDLLQCFRIGRLSPQDAVRAKEESSKVVVAKKHAKWRYLTSTVAVATVAASWPILEIVRWTLRALNFFLPLGGHHLALAISKFVPFSIPGIGTSAKLKRGSGARVAVLGGGIAGVGAAYTLQKSGFNVEIYEARDKLGGNAQVFEWNFENGKKTRQDVAVLFWSNSYYKNYVALLKELDISWTDVRVNYLLHTNYFSQDKTKFQYYTPPGTAMHEQGMGKEIYNKYKADFDKYDRMITLARWCNNIFTLDTSKTFYKHNTLWAAFNPMNFIPLWVMAKIVGISPEFYEGILRPFQGYQFSTINIDRLPSVALPVLDDIVSLTKSSVHQSWGPNNSEEVFTKATRKIKTHLKTRVRRVEFSPTTGNPIVIDDHGNAQEFDRVVFTIPAPQAAAILSRDGNSVLERVLLNGVKYQDDFVRDDWKDWLEVPVHADESVVPNTGGMRDVILKNFAFVVDVDVRLPAGPKAAEYLHQQGSWSPNAKAAGLHGKPMLMTQCQLPSKPIDASKVVGHFSPPRGHPALNLESLMVTQLLTLIQGRRGLYFAGNYTSGGNGHDLSFLSGIACATAMGAAYPFPWDAGAERDHVMMKRFMGLI